MAKIPNIRAEEITEKDILSLYERILPLLYHNPKRLDLSNEINKSLLKFVYYDFYYFFTDDPQPSLGSDIFLPYFEKWYDPNNKDEFSRITTMKLKSTTPRQRFNSLIKQTYEKIIAQTQTRFPKQPKEYHRHRIMSFDSPAIVLEFFRFKRTSPNNSYSANEKKIFEKLKPHIIMLYKTVANDLRHSKTFMQFDAYFNICFSIANTHDLSEAESKLLPEILYGYSNDEISKRNFVSVNTVKTHIRHIFKKTGTKNRVDFIGKFFISPDRIKIH